MGWDGMADFAVGGRGGTDLTCCRVRLVPSWPLQRVVCIALTELRNAVPLEEWWFGVVAGARCTVPSVSCVRIERCRAETSHQLALASKMRQCGAADSPFPTPSRSTS